MSSTSLRTLYRRTLRAALSFPSYNFRTYFFQHTRLLFRSLPAQPTSSEITALEDELASIRRQALLQRSFDSPLLVVEAETPQGRSLFRRQVQKSEQEGNREWPQGSKGEPTERSDS
ncbi:hypothetical protein BT69DRAFT_1286292 [Atractiella rhizophila]|nr:hypothetical protein BT69DRAFT_1286292 [Atractiella rhizophila]